jgi:hypothetical protein
MRDYLRQNFRRTPTWALPPFALFEIFAFGRIKLA